MKKLVIIGGGFAGSHVAKELEGKFEVTLIDTKNYFEFTPGILRTIIDPEHIKKIQVQHTDYLKKAKIVLGEVTEVNGEEIKIKDESYEYNYLVICSGSGYNSPIKEQNLIITTRANNLGNCFSKLEKAKKVLIIGGGLVGVELAAEICDKYRNKEIIMVHSRERLIIRNEIRSSDYAKKYLKEKGVKIIYNEKLISSTKNEYLTNKGRKIKADIAFLCTGIRPNSGFMEKNLSKYLDKKGFIKVNDYLQLKGKENIFIVGDVNNIEQEKTAQNAEEQAKITVKNIMLKENGESFVKYKLKKSPLVISLGKYNGIFEWKNIVITGFVPAAMKYLIEKIVMRKLKLLI